METVYQFTATIDYDMRLDYYKDKFAYFDPDVTRVNFPPNNSGKQQVRLEVINPVKQWIASDATASLAQLGLQSPCVHDLVVLAISADQQQLRRLLDKYIGIAALCPPWRNNRGVLKMPTLWMDRVVKDFGLELGDLDGIHLDLLLAVRK